MRRVSRGPKRGGWTGCAVQGPTVYPLFTVILTTSIGACANNALDVSDVSDVSKASASSELIASSRHEVDQLGFAEQMKRLNLVPREVSLVVGAQPMISELTAERRTLVPDRVAIPADCQGAPAGALRLPVEEGRFREGATYEYAMEMSATGVIDMSTIQASMSSVYGYAPPPSEAGQQSFNQDLETTVVFKVASTEGGLRFVGRLVDPRIRYAGDSPAQMGEEDIDLGDPKFAALMQMLQQQLSEPFEIAADADGTFRELHLSESMPPRMVTVLTTILQEFNVGVPRDGVPSSWKSSVEETAGRFTYCNLARTSGDEGVRVSSVRFGNPTLRSYDDFDGSMKEEPATGDALGSREILIDDRGGFFAQASRHEQVELKVVGDRVRTSLIIASEIRLLSVTAPNARAKPGFAVEAPAGLIGEPRSVAFGLFPKETITQARLAEPQDVTDRVVDFVASLRGEQLADTDVFEEAFGTIADLTKYDRVNVGTIAHLIKNGELPMENAQVLFAGLARGNSADLVELYRWVMLESAGDIPGSFRSSVLNNLPLLTRPSPELYSEVLEPLSLRQDLDMRSETLLMMGAVAHSAKEHAPEQHDRTAQFLEGQLTLARDANEISPVLYAMGNCGAERSMDALLEQLDTAADDGLRKIALHAMRFSARPDVREALKRSLVESEASDLRMTAARSLAFSHQPDALPALADALQDPVESVRERVLELLPPFGSEHTETIMGMLRFAAEQDPAPALRDRATKMHNEMLTTQPIERGPIDAPRLMQQR